MPQKTGFILAYDRLTFTEMDREDLYRIHDVLPKNKECLIKFGIRSLFVESEGGVSLWAEGREFVKKELPNFGIFADFKLFDTHKTVEAAAKSVATFGPYMATCAWSESFDAHEQFARACSEKGVISIGVTLLTDIDATRYRSQFGRFPGPVVTYRSKYYLDRGFKGVTCSGEELQALQREWWSDQLEKVVLGVRLPGDPPSGQRRMVTPLEAIRNGATYLGVGDPILGKDVAEPVAATLRYLEAMDKAE